MERRGREWDREMTGVGFEPVSPWHSSPYMVGATACATVPPTMTLLD